MRFAMSLHKIEIKVGTVAYFNAKALNADDRVEGATVPRDGPFVCVQTAMQRSAWTPLTTQFRRERLVLENSWRLDGSVKWQSDDLYLNDGANTQVGDD